MTMTMRYEDKKNRSPKRSVKWAAKRQDRREAQEQIRLGRAAWAKTKGETS
jgi:hypothetical protein